MPKSKAKSPAPKRKAKPEREAPARRGRREEEDEAPKRGRGDRDRSPRRAKSGLEFESYKMKGHVFGELEVTEVRMALLDDRDSSNVALCSITLNDDFSVGGLRVVQDGRKGGGLFVSMPQRKNDNGEYKDTSFPLTKEGREVISEAVLDAYDQAGGK